MALLEELQRGQSQQGQQRPQTSMQGEPSPESGPPMSDVDAAVEQAMGSGQMQAPGRKTKMASPEQHKKLKGILDSVEMAIHGKTSDKVLDLIRGPKDPFEGISSAAHILSISSYMQAKRQGLDVGPELYLAQKGAVQQTVEMLWEVAEAADLVDRDDQEQLSAAYLNTIRKLGETMLEQENPAAVKSAQEFLVAMETGENVDASELFREEGSMDAGPPDRDMGRMLRGGQVMPDQMPQRPSRGPQMPQQGGMPPMRRG